MEITEKQARAMCILRGKDRLKWDESLDFQLWATVAELVLLGLVTDEPALGAPTVRKYNVNYAGMDALHAYFKLNPNFAQRSGVSLEDNSRIGEPTGHGRGEGEAGSEGTPNPWVPEGPGLDRDREELSRELGRSESSER